MNTINSQKEFRELLINDENWSIVEVMVDENSLFRSVAHQVVAVLDKVVNSILRSEYLITPFSFYALVLFVQFCCIT